MYAGPNHVAKWEVAHGRAQGEKAGIKVSGNRGRFVVLADHTDGELGQEGRRACGDEVLGTEAGFRDRALEEDQHG